MTDTVSKERLDWVCYDAECALCVRWVERFRAVLERRGFILMPLQSPAVRAALALPDDDLLVEMRVITRDGLIFGGADALIYLSRFISKPLFVLTHIPGVTPLLRRIYRLIARNRTCGAGACRIAGRACHYVRAARLQQDGAHGVTRPTRKLFVLSALEVGNLADWLPLLLLVAAAAVIGRHFAPWVYMWSLALAMIIGTKWFCLRRELANSPRAGLGRKIGFFSGWIGMDAAAFLKSSRLTRSAEFIPRVPKDGETRGMNSALRSCDQSGFEGNTTAEWAPASFKTLLGAAFVWAGAQFALRVYPPLAGWTGMVGLVLLLHFGLFHLLALAWHTAGVPVKPLMRAPLLSRSLGEFWGERWNTAFNELATKFIFRPLHRSLGLRATTMLVFLISGLLHDLIISVPARGGYGLPTLYFLFQGAGVLFERTRAARRLGITRGLRARVWTLLVTGAPVFWLFHPAFIRNVILPFLKAIGAT